MRILHLIYDDIGNPWLGGGGAVRTWEIYSRIAARGHHVTVLCGRYPGAARLVRRGAVTYRRVGLSRSYVLSRLTYVLGAARLLKQGGYDIVIEDVSPFSPVGSPRWKPAEIPVVASVQNLSGAHATAKYGLPGWGPRLVERPLLSLFTNFIAVSPGIAGHLKSTLGGHVNVRVIPNSVDPAFFAGHRVALEQGSPSAYILCLGRIDVYQKGLDRVVQVFDLLAARDPDIRLVIAGGGTPAQVRRLDMLVAGARHRERIEVIGPVEREQAVDLMKNALLLAMPSRYEAWPLSALEAGAAGVPVVGSDIVGVRDAAPAYPRAHGILMPGGDTAALAEAMLKVATQPEWRAAIGERGRLWAARYTWDALAEAQLEYYAYLVQSGK